MRMKPRLRQFALTAHVTASVGWVGAVVAFLGLSIAGLVSDNPDTVRGVYLVMDLTAWYILVPFAVASLLTGIVQSLGTKWGLFRHYWVLAKLAINVFATIVLVMYMETLRYFADLAEATTGADVAALRSASPAIHAVAALVLLVVATILGIYKPRGVTRYGRRRTTNALS
jgi:uncharacterized membrane protein